MRTASTLRTLFATTVALSVASSAFAQNAKVEAAARALQKKAVQSDYLATDFDKAKAKLEKAISDCAGDKCSPELSAELHRDLGVVLVGGLQEVDAGVQAFAKALAINSSIELDPDLKTSEIEAAFEKAKAGAKSGGKGKGPKAPVERDEDPEGDFDHEPWLEQVVNTPLPIYAEYTGSEDVVRVTARYRAPGMREWKTLELKHMGESGWGAELACAEVQPGTLKYFLQGFDSANDPVVAAGDRNNPFQTVIKQSITEDAPRLPGRQPPKRCAEVGDCPPGFPGCNDAGAEGLLKEADVPCEEDGECKSGTCLEGKCTEPKDKPRFRKVWIGGGFMVDGVLLPSAENVCSLDKDVPSNTAGYYCMDQSGKDFPTRGDNGASNNSIQKGGNSVDGGFAFAKVRVLASFDYAPVEFFMIGVRLGVALPGGYNGQEAKTDAVTAAAPWLHAEARGTFILGKDGLAAIGVRPYVYGAFGLAAYDAKVAVKVRTVENGGAPVTNDITAYKLQGQAPLALGLGAGVRWALSDRAALLGGARATLAIGKGVMPAFAPELGVQFGF